MTRDEAVDRTHQRTRRLAENAGIDMQIIYADNLQDLCLAYRFPWRKKWHTFSSIVGTGQYDLTTSTNGTGTDVEELIRIIRVDSATSQTELDYISDPTTEMFQQHSTTTGDPAGYFVVPGTISTIQLVDTPNAVKTYRYLYWAVPAPAADDSVEAIPLLPSIYHHVLVSLMVMDVWESLPGEGIESPNYQKAAAKAQRQIQGMMDRHLSVQEKREFITKVEAIRST